MKTIIHFKNIEEFETNRLLARRMTAKDFDLLIPMYQNELIMATLGGVVSEKVAREKIQKSLDGWNSAGFGVWLWFEKGTKKFVARAGLRELQLEGEDVVEVGYVLIPDFWKQGFATEMASASVEIANEILKLQNLVCYTSITNKASQNVMQKAGFKYDRNFMYLDEEHTLYRFILE